MHPFLQLSYDPIRWIKGSWGKKGSKENVCAVDSYSHARSESRLSALIDSSASKERSTSHSSIPGPIRADNQVTQTSGDKSRSFFHTSSIM